MKKVIASAGMLALGAISLQSARADEMVSAPDKPWSISGTLRGFYDDNYNTQPSGPAHKGSTGIEVRPRVDVSHAVGSTTITGTYIYDVRYYDSRPGNKTDQSHDVEFFLNHNFSARDSVDLTESFVDSQEPEVIDRSLSLPLRANGDNLRNNVAINYHTEVTPLLGFVVGYANTFYDYTAKTPGVNGPSYGTSLNRFEHLATLNSRWHVAQETVLILGYQFGAVDYLGKGSLAPAGPVFPGGPPFAYVSPKSRDNYSHYAYVGVEHSFSSDFDISARGGIQVADYYNAAPGDNQGSLSPFVDLSANYTYADGGVATVGFRNSKNQTDVGFNATTMQTTQDQESSSIYGSLTQKLTPLSPKLTGSLTAEYQNSRFNGGGAFNNQTDQFYLLGLNLSYQFNHYFSAEAGYNYDKLVSDLSGRSYDRNRVYVGVTGSY